VKGTHHVPVSRVLAIAAGAYVLIFLLMPVRCTGPWDPRFEFTYTLTHSSEGRGGFAHARGCAVVVKVSWGTSRVKGDRIDLKLDIGLVRVTMDWFSALCMIPSIE